jgi:hypothetical protein
MKQYVTFGQDHRHEIGGVHFDADCVALYEAATYDEGREKAFRFFGSKFCFHYADEPPDMRFFPDGFMRVPE